MGLVIAGLAGCGGVEVDGETDANTGAAIDAAPDAAVDANTEPPPDPDVVLLYDFQAPLIQDGADLFVADASGGGHRGAVTPGTVPGSVMIVTRADGAGDALRFPDPCVTDCPRVNLVAEDSAGLDPGGLDFAISVDLLVPEDAPGDENVAQKGFFDSPGGQWKIELGDNLRPICIFRYGAGTDEFFNAGIQQPINDGQWHTVRCERRGGVLEGRLDGGEGPLTRTVEIPEGVTFAVENGEEILVGGQAQGASSDQFYGILDNVKVEIFAAR